MHLPEYERETLEDYQERQQIPMWEYQRMNEEQYQRNIERF